MARHKEFDQEQVLEKALDLFWTKGYEQTSVQDLCGHLGIHRGSLYDTFGDKHALFLACLDRYSVMTDEDLYAILLKEGPPKKQLESFFAKVIDDSMDNAVKRRGCFITNTAMEVASFDPNVAKRVEARMLNAETSLYRFLLRAQQNGGLTGKSNLRELARFLLNTKQGLHVMAKTAIDRSVLEDACKIAISAVL